MRHPLCLLVVYHQKDEIEISGDEWGKKARLLYTLKGLNIRRLKIFLKKKKCGGDGLRGSPSDWSNVYTCTPGANKTK